MNNPELKPCPSCKADGKSIELEIGSVNGIAMARFKCNKCGFCAEPRHKLMDAADEWNRRAEAKEGDK